MTIRRKKLSMPFEVKSVKADGTFTGIASPFGTMDYGRDIVMPGAFTKTLQDFASKGRRVPMLWQHARFEPIGGYPELKETDDGLEVFGECNMEVQRGRECHALFKKGDISGLSIGYTTERDEWDEQMMVRRLFEVKLYEISPVTFPMHDDARVESVKSIETLADCERRLRDEGFSRKEALAFIARVKAIAGQSDSEPSEAECERALQILRS